MSLLDQLRASVSTPPAGRPPQAVAVASPPPATENSPTAPQAQPQAPAEPCRCGFRTFWLDPYGNWHCQACRLPKFAFLVRRAITIGSDGEISETRAADESRYDNFVEIVGADGRTHLVNKNCLDPRSDYFDTEITKKISMGVEDADRESLRCHNYLSKILGDNGSIHPLPGPRPITKENFSMASAEKSADEKNKKSVSKPAKRAASGGARGGRRR